MFAAVCLTVIRAISGLGYSEQAVNTTYLNELYGNRKSRGFIYAFIQGGWPIGVLLASAFTALLLGTVGWRGVFMLATIPALIVAGLGFRLKESPRFLAMKRVRQLEKENRHEEAVEFGRHFDIDVHHVQETTLQQIFEPDIRRHTIFLSLAFLTNWIGIQVFAVLGTTVLTEGKGVSFGSALTVLIVSNAAAYIGYLCHGFVGDRIGRRLTIAGGWVISGLAYTLMLFGPDSQGFRADDVHDRALLHNRALRGPAVLHGRVVPDQGARHGSLFRQRYGPDRGDRWRGVAHGVPHRDRG